MHPAKSQLKGTLALLLCALAWGMAFSAQSSAMAHIPPYAFVCLRSLITSAVLLPAIPLFRRLSRAPARREGASLRRHLAVGGLLGLILFASTAMQQIALVRTSVAKSGFVTALYIVIVPLIGLFLGRRVRALTWLGVALSVTGMFLLCVRDDFSIEPADLLTLCCAIVYAFHIICVDRYAGDLDAMLLTAIQFAVTAVAGAIATALFESVTLEGVRACLPGLMYVGVCSGAIGYTLQMVGQKYTEPTLASLLMCLESVFAALGGWLLLGQALTPRELIGCALMLAASMIAQLPGPARSPAREDAV